MAYKPKPGAPRTLREMFHYLWGELKSIEANGGGGGPGVTDHADLTNVTADQHHNQNHLLNSPDHTNVADVNATEGQILQHNSGLWTPVDKSAIGVTDHALLTGVQENQHHNKVHFLVGKGPAGQHDHGDVQSDVFPNEGDHLIYRGDVSTGEWKVEPFPTGGGGSDHDRVHSLTSGLDHSDVANNVDGVPTWGILLFHTGQWQSTVDLPTATTHALYGNGSLGANLHSDVDPTNPLVQGSYLSWDTASSKFVGTNPTALGYGALRQATEVLLADLGAGWVTVPFDTAVFVSPENVLQEPASDALTPQEEGAWQISINISLEHNESNGGRNMAVRLFNLTDGVGTDGMTVFVGRNQAGSNITVSFLTEITAANKDKQYTLQLSGLTDSFTAVNLLDATFDMARI